MNELKQIFEVLRDIKRGASSRRLSSWVQQAFDGGMDEADAIIILDARPDGLRIGELSQLLGSSQANTTRTARVLEKKGLAERDVSPTDGRGRMLRLTKLGRQRATVFLTRRRRIWERMFAGFSPGDLQTLLTTLQQVLAAHDKLAAELDDE